jgi:hypothetical protein
MISGLEAKRVCDLTASLKGNTLSYHFYLIMSQH